MSLILDALKKLDREKSSRRRKGAANIAAEILKPDPPRPQTRTLVYFAAVSLTAVAAAVITYGLMGGFGSLWKTSPPAAVKSSEPSQLVPPAPPKPGSMLTSSSPASVNPPVPSKQVASVPTKSGPPKKSSPPLPGKPPAPTLQDTFVPPKPDSPPKSSSPVPVTPPAPGQQVSPAAPSGEPVRDAREEIKRVPQKIQDSAESKTPASFPGEKKPSQNVISKGEEVAPGSARKSPDPPPKESAATPPLLKISGIVWHEEPSERRAVINGSFTKEGSVIEGVKVVEIFPTRVRFSHNGRIFEISVFE
jgi:hypothetical protein